MIKFHQLFDEKNIRFRARFFVQTAVSRGDCVSVMKENSIAGHAMRAASRSSPSIRLISHIRYMIRKYGDLIAGILWIMGRNMIPLYPFFSNSKNYSIRYPKSLFPIQEAKIANM
jgi:hypothetical protein